MEENKQVFYTRFMYRFLFACLLAALPLFSLPLEDRLEKSKSGDYLVVEGGKMITILSVRSVSPASIILEEISAPSRNLKERPRSWADWIRAKAPGHSSWSMIEMDRSNGEVLECYSFSRSAWIHLSSQESIFATLLKLPIAPIPDAARRRIGPPPREGEADVRKIWEPPVVFEGEKQEGVRSDAYLAGWPEDGSPLAGNTVLLYFDRETQFPFPFWIQVETAHANVSLRAIDAGRNLPALHRSFPRRVPQFVGQPKKSKDGLRLSLKSPKYHRNFELFAVDATRHEKQIYPIAHSSIQGENESLTIEISECALNEILKPDHLYTWLLIPEGHAELYAETTKPFIWTKNL